MRKMMDLKDIRWDRYPAVALQALARRWIENQVLLGMAPNTVDAYARSVQDFLVFCEKAGISATEAPSAEKCSGASICVPVCSFTVRT